MAMNPQPVAEAQMTLRDLIKSSCTGYRSNLLDKYDAFDAETQRNLFHQLWEEYAPFLRLAAADRRLPACNRVDVETLHYDQISVLEFNDSYVDPYEFQNRLAQQWVKAARELNDDGTDHGDDGTDHGDDGTDHGVDDAMSDSNEPETSHVWNSYQIYTTPGSPSVKVVSQGTFTAPNGSCLFYDMISSQLLLYRLIAMFGTPPKLPEEEANADRYKSIWEYPLHWAADQGRNKSTLWFQDYKGAASVHFSGSEEASEAAFKLLEWLVSDNVLHTYDGVLAGNQA
ncbi:hypothetical protein QQZ08_005865 [Neonectria magnoliae]|uniref:Uncharacterized protein n=1 Tax=Neonectria magnoliae TaxID=2732573 RepID=A0ABR1I213_9HYPO